MNAGRHKVVLITGAARGIGYATAKRFLADGWRVALLDIDSETLARNHQALAAPDTTLALHCDVSDADAVAAAVAAVAVRFGRVDALVNNAGIAVFKPILETTLADWSRMLAVNLTGPFICTQAVAPLMREQGGGSIVNITSISGLRASTLARRLRHQQGRARASDQAAGGRARRRSASASMPSRRVRSTRRWRRRCTHRRSAPTITTPSRSIATGSRRNWRKPSFFLCSDRASYITGQMLAVDGGFEADRHRSADHAR